MSPRAGAFTVVETRGDCFVSLGSYGMLYTLTGSLTNAE